MKIPVPHDHPFKNFPCRGIRAGLIAAMLLLVCSSAVSQRYWPSELWHDGKIVLIDGDTLKGSVKYDFQQNLVQYVVNNRKAEVYSSRKVLFFEIFDETVHRYRKFFALPYTNTSNYRSPMFFELLVEGDMTLLSRDLLEYKTYNSGFYGGSYTRLTETYHYFLLKPNGDIEDFKGSRNDLLAMMGDKGKMVEKYIRQERLDFDDKYDVAKMVAYYNSLAGS